MEGLKYLKTGCGSLIIGGNKLIAKRSTNGCKGCAFDNGNGAEYCSMKGYCMAHCRPDRTPVIFVVK